MSGRWFQSRRVLAVLAVCALAGGACVPHTAKTAQAPAPRDQPPRLYDTVRQVEEYIRSGYDADVAAVAHEAIAFLEQRAKSDRQASDRSRYR